MFPPCFDPICLDPLLTQFASLLLAGLLSTVSVSQSILPVSFASSPPRMASGSTERSLVSMALPACKKLTAKSQTLFRVVKWRKRCAFSYH